MTSNYAITTDVANIWPQAKQGTLTIYNNGPATVYIDSGTSVSTQSLPLPPLSSVEWKTGQALFAKCAKGTATLSMDFSATLLDNSRSAYMQTILNMALFDNATVEFECGSYQTLLCSGSVDGPFVPNPIVKGFSVFWYDSNGNFLNYERINFWAVSTQPLFNIVIPVKGARAQLVLNTTVNANTISNFLVAGSTREVRTSSTISQARVWYATDPALAIASFYRDTLVLDPWDGSAVYLPAVSNHMQVAINFVGTVAGQIDIVEVSTGNIYANLGIVAAPGLARTDLISPTSVPLAIQKSAVFPPTFSSASLTVAWDNV